MFELRVNNWLPDGPVVPDRGDALGGSTWLLRRADPQLAVLLSKDAGPLSAGKPGRHQQLDPLPQSPPQRLREAATFNNLK
jgi:hypothetical protein